MKMLLESMRQIGIKNKGPFSRDHASTQNASFSQNNQSSWGSKNKKKPTCVKFQAPILDVISNRISKNERKYILTKN